LIYSTFIYIKGSASTVNQIMVVSMKAINASGEFGLRHANGDTRKVYKARRKATAVGSKSFIRYRVIKGGYLYEYNK
jgi:hypothetical protein